MEVDHFAFYKVRFTDKYHFCAHGTVRKIMKYGEGEELKIPDMKIAVKSYIKKIRHTFYKMMCRVVLLLFKASIV